MEANICLSALVESPLHAIEIVIAVVISVLVTYHNYIKAITF